MAIYKPSNFYPNLEEIDLNENNIFSCQINTSGSNIFAYKLKFLTEDNIELSDIPAVSLDKVVKNKGFLNIDKIQTSNYPELINGKNYKWSIRVYDTFLNSVKQPDTLVCSGFLVGSTKNVIWTTNNDKLETGKWIQFKTTGSSSMMPILDPNVDNLKLPSAQEEYVERHQIDWVTTELGYEKNITKIETDEEFVYNYIDETKFTIYQCSDKHGYNNIFVDPNDMIDLGMNIEIYNGDSMVEPQRKIIGYSEDTGEIRVQEPFSNIPQNGYTYKLYKKNDNNEYEEVSFKTSNLIGGSPIEDNSFKIMTNVWSSSKKRLFIQPNINIKSDDTNPNEIVFNNGVRVDIEKRMDGTNDITFNKLDNTQWIILGPALNIGGTPPIIPKSNYKVYSDFMDSMPENIFYAKDSPNIVMKYRNYNTKDNYEEISSEGYKSFRDVEFQTFWSSPQNVQIKNYQYLLYDNNMNLISESEIIYDNELLWSFRGLDTSRNEQIPNQYYIKIIIEDEYGKIFEKQQLFKIYYYIEEAVLPLIIKNNCDKMAFDIEFTTPIYVPSLDYQGIPSVNENNLELYNRYLNIPLNKIAYYSRLDTLEELYIDIPKDFSYITSFQIDENFIKQILNNKDNNMAIILQLGHKNNLNEIDIYTLKLGSFEKLYFYNENGTLKVIDNPNQFKFRVYKNDSESPLMCFSNNTKDYFDISENDINQELAITSKINYALQDNSNNNYIIVSYLPTVGEINKKYVLTQTYSLKNITYYKGVYIYNKKWERDNNIEYVFIDKLSNYINSSYSSLNVPENCKDSDNDTIKFADSNNVFIESNNLDLNSEIVSKKWFNFYLNITDGENVICDMEMNNERS